MASEETTDDTLEENLRGLLDVYTLPENDREDLVDATGVDITDIDRVSTFAEAGVLTGNKGIALRLQDGREFQITIVQSR